jgi:hypothetical protein
MYKAPKLGSTEILGVSHLVLGTKEMVTAEQFLARYGHSKYGEMEVVPNPPEKAPFVAGTLSRTFDMKLMVSPAGGPPVELLVENNERGRQDTEEPQDFEAVLAAKGDLEPQELLESLGRERSVPFVGFREVGSDPRFRGIAALLVHCQGLDVALPLWRALGYEAIPLGSGVANINIRGAMPTNRLNVYFVVDKSRSEIGYLNRPGIVCLSLFCRDSDRLRSLLSERGFFVGECFTLEPFGHTFRTFFVRNTNGEIYEFLSVVREKGRMGRSFG